jgi:hypothetical protein
MANHRRGDWSDVDASFARMGVADGIAIHHTASVPQGLAYDPAYLRRIEHGEIAAGYNALAYHTMWFDDGDSAESRPYGAMGAATGGHNGHTIAHCAVGYFHPPYNHEPSDAMCIALAQEIYWLRTAGFLTWEAPVLPHRTWTAGTQWATACCGDLFVPKVAWIDEMSRAPWVPPGPGPTPVPPPEDDDMAAAIDYNGQLTTFRVNASGDLVETWHSASEGKWFSLALAGPNVGVSGTKEPARVGVMPSIVRGWSGNKDRLDVFADAVNGGLVHAWYLPGDAFYSEIL